MKWKRTDGESAKAVREYVFLPRYKSEPGIVEFSVSRSSASCQYCHSCPWSVAIRTENILTLLKRQKKIFNAYSYLYLSVNRTGSVTVLLSVCHPCRL